jgi:acetyl esterase/lipase
MRLHKSQSEGSLEHETLPHGVWHVRSTQHALVLDALARREGLRDREGGIALSVPAASASRAHGHSALCDYTDQQHRLWPFGKRRSFGAFRLTFVFRSPRVFAVLLRTVTFHWLLLLGLLAGGLPPARAQKPPVVPEGVRFESGIEYANPDGQHLQLDLARPRTGDGPFPAILCIHGGGFRAGSRQVYDALCIRLAQRGYVALTVSYRLAPKYRFPAAVHDVKAAVRWVRANARKFRLDSDRIGVTGGSAGGHLAQFLGVTAGVKEFEGDGGHATQSSAVACVVNVYGPSDFTRSYGKSVDAAEVLPLFLGGNLDTARRQHLRASPLYWVTPDAAPTLCIHGTQDKYVAHEQAVWLVDRLQAAGVEAELLTLKGAGHGFTGKDAETAERAMMTFFDKHLKKQGTGSDRPKKGSP